MKTMLGWILAGAIAGSPLLATQEPQPEKEKQKKEEPKKPPAPNPGQEPQDEGKPKPKPERPKQEPAPQPKQEEKQRKEQEKQQKEQTRQNKHETAPANGRQSAPGGHARGTKIPDAKFRVSFGREHHFRVASSARDDRRFQYGGYWFELVEVWPAGWSFDDDCFIEEEDDDYYLVDYIHPEYRVLVIVVEG